MTLLRKLLMTLLKKLNINRLCYSHAHLISRALLRHVL